MRFALLLLLLNFLSGLTQAQVWFGLRGGIAQTTMIGQSADPNGKAAWGYQLGGFVDWGITDNWHLQLDLQSARKGYQNDSTELKLNYGVISPTLSYLFSGFEGETVRGRLLGGLYAGRLFDWKRTVADYREIFYDWDYGIVWGGGLLFAFHAPRARIWHHLHLDLRANVGTRWVYTEGAKVRNVVWQLSLGYVLPRRL